MARPRVEPAWRQEDRAVSISRHQAVGAYRRWEPEDFDAPAGKGSAPPPEAFAPADLAGLMQAAPDRKSVV